MYHKLLFFTLLKQSYKSDKYLSGKRDIIDKSLKIIKKNFTGKGGKNTFTSKPVNW